MSKFTFTPEQLALLEQLPCVAKVTPRMVVFAQRFKQDALSQFKAGESRRNILRNAGIDDARLSNDAIKYMFQSWAKQDLNNPSKKKGRPKSKPEIGIKNMNLEQLRAKCALQEAEIEFLKKVHALD